MWRRQVVRQVVLPSGVAPTWAVGQRVQPSARWSLPQAPQRAGRRAMRVAKRTWEIALGIALQDTWQGMRRRFEVSSGPWAKLDSD